MKVSLNLIVPVAFYFNVAPGKCVIAYEAHLWGLNFEFWFVSIGQCCPRHPVSSARTAMASTVTPPPACALPGGGLPGEHGAHVLSGTPAPGLGEERRATICMHLPLVPVSMC